MKVIRVVTWNCNGAFRKKWQAVEALNADILVIQECEDPRQTTDLAYQSWSSDHLWTGLSKNRGLGIFPKRGISVSAVGPDLGPLQLFLPCVVDGKWPLLATWTLQANSSTFGYIGQLWKLLQSHSAFLTHSGAMLVGDLNSNARWDVWDRWWNHSDVVQSLSKLGLLSAYHQHFEEPQGAEQRPTFFLQRKLAKPYHIDYAFTGPQWSVKHVEVGEPSQWLAFSDHMPVVFDLVCDVIR